MRRSGLTHLLSVSGLHIAAVVGAAMLLTLKLLALSERLALRFNLILVAAGVGALAGVAYTLLTGAQVPTVRSCIAALLVLAGIALGRDAISMRLLAVGALVVLLFRPEALAGASFQLSFAAVASIIALHSSGWARRLFQRRDEGLAARIGRALLAMVATGLAVEIALIPFALYHFHKAGPLRRRRQHHRHPADDLRHHAARGRRAAARRRRDRRAVVVARPACRSTCCSGSPTGSPSARARWRCWPRCRRGRFALIDRRRPVAVPVDQPGAAARAGADRCSARRRGGCRRRPTCWSPATAGTSRWSTTTARRCCCASAAAISSASSSPKRPASTTSRRRSKRAPFALLARQLHRRSSSAAGGAGRSSPPARRNRSNGRRWSILRATPTSSCRPLAAAGCTPRWLKLDRARSSGPAASRSTSAASRASTPSRRGSASIRGRLRPREFGYAAAACQQEERQGCRNS